MERTGEILSETSKSIRQRIEQAAKWAYMADDESPEGNNCHNICRYIAEKLKETTAVEVRGSDSHGFLYFSDQGKWIADPQYLQFVSRGERQGLPPVMYVSVRSREELIEGLVKHRIPDKFHHLWENEIKK